MGASARISELEAPVAGTALRVERQGDGGNTVFVHGLGGDIHSWDAIWAAIDDRPMTRYDLRGFGLSPAGSSAPFDHVEDLLALLDALAIDQCDLIGLSMGGGIALRFALDHPGRVRRLALISPMIAGWEWSDAWMTAWRPVTRAARRGDMDAARRAWWAHPVFDSVRGTVAGQAVEAEIMRFPGDQWVRDDQRPVLPDVERLHTLKPPTLLLSGGCDHPDFQLMAELIAGSGEAVNWIVRPAMGHMLQLEDPAGCAGAITGHFWSD